MLGLAADSITDDVDFSELGMDSLMAVELRNRLERSMAVTLGSTAAFEWPTLRTLSEHVADDLLGISHDRTTATTTDGATRSASADPDADGLAATGAAPASAAQRRFLFLSDFDPDAALFNVPNGARLIGPLDVEALQRAFDEVVRRHEALRTVFEVGAHDVLQVVEAPRAVPFDVRDLRTVPREELTTRSSPMRFARKPSGHLTCAEGPCSGSSSFAFETTSTSSS